MARRKHLRSRVFALTACFALTLFAVAFFLTWRAKQAQSRAERLISVDLRLVATMGEVIRNQNGYHQRWIAAAEGSPDELKALSGRYGMVIQVFDIMSGDEREMEPLRQFAQAYRSRAEEAAARWPFLPPDLKAAELDALDARSRAVVREAESILRFHARATDVELPVLERQASDMILIALAMAWVIAILSFAVARLTLAKVVRPIEVLSQAAEQIAEGDLSARAPIGGDREIAQLGTAFNRMAEALSRSYSELRERARTDELTALPNFRAFREVIDGELERASRYGHTFGILVLDLDHFKQYNDRFGHQAGNEALERVARAIRSSIRAVDFPARYGGEEFAVILPEIDAIGLQTIAERIRAAIEALPAAENCAPLTASAGGALFPLDGASAAPLFEAADERLYEAKSRGRNRIVVPAGSAVALPAGA